MAKKLFITALMIFSTLSMRAMASGRIPSDFYVGAASGLDNCVDMILEKLEQGTDQTELIEETENLRAHLEAGVFTRMYELCWSGLSDYNKAQWLRDFLNTQREHNGTQESEQARERALEIYAESRNLQLSQVVAKLYTRLPDDDIEKLCDFADVDCVQEKERFAAQLESVKKSLNLEGPVSKTRLRQLYRAQINS